MNQEKIDALVTYIQERCLWQFHSRSWDRKENIEGVLSRTYSILAELPVRNETDAERCWHADAKVLASEFRSNFPWVDETKAEELKGIIDGVKTQLMDIAVEKSRNEELHIPNY